MLVATATPGRPGRLYEFVHKTLDLAQTGAGGKRVAPPVDGRGGNDGDGDGGDDDDDDDDYDGDGRRSISRGADAAAVGVDRASIAAIHFVDDQPITCMSTNFAGRFIVCGTATGVVLVLSTR